MFRLLLDIGVQVICHGEGGGHLLHRAAWNGRQQACELLIQWGADVNSAVPGRIPLCWTAQPSGGTWQSGGYLWRLGVVTRGLMARTGSDGRAVEGRDAAAVGSCRALGGAVEAGAGQGIGQLASAWSEEEEGVREAVLLVACSGEHWYSDRIE